MRLSLYFAPPNLSRPISRILGTRLGCRRVCSAFGLRDLRHHSFAAASPSVTVSTTPSVVGAKSRLGAAIALVTLTSSATAFGQTDATLDDRASGLAALRRPTGMAEFGAGWLTLPGAEVCVERSQAGCKRGDTSFELEAWQLYRADLDFAFGAGATLGLITTTDAPRSDPVGVERDHSRNYFTVEMIARYYPYVGRTLEAWVGLTGGLIVVSDTFDSRVDTSDTALVGPRGLTIRTEGYTVGVAVGAAYALAAQWSVGATLRYGNWFLPREPERNVLGDEASLTGRNAMFAFGLSVAYRIPL